MHINRTQQIRGKTVTNILAKHLYTMAKKSFLFFWWKSNNTCQHMEKFSHLKFCPICSIVDKWSHIRNLYLYSKLTFFTSHFKNTPLGMGTWAIKHQRWQTALTPLLASPYLGAGWVERLVWWMKLTQKHGLHPAYCMIEMHHSVWVLASSKMLFSYSIVLSIKYIIYFPRCYWIKFIFEH